MGTRTIKFIALVGSCVVIYLLFTNRERIYQQVIRTFRPIVADSAFETILPTDTPTEAPTAVWTPITVPTPLPPPTIKPTMETKVVEEGEGYRIEQTSGGKNGAEISVNVPEGFPLQELSSITICNVVKDIAGGWQIGDRRIGETFDCALQSDLKFDSNGVAKINLPKGYYALFQHHHIGIHGYWGNALVANRWPAYVFPVEFGWITKVNFTISKLEVGLLDKAGTNALPGMKINLFSQTQDIAGKRISHNISPLTTSIVDPTGIATFYIGHGTYFISIYGFPASDKFVYDITVKAGEVKRITTNFP